MEQQSPPIDRPPPGHNRSRLSAVLGELPAGEARTAAEWRSPTTAKRLLILSRRRRTGQMTLPIESVRG